MQFSELLKTLRIKAGHQNARAFHDGLKEHSELTITYSNYTRIEKGLITPTFETVLILAKYLKVQDFQSFVSSYLESQIQKEELLQFFKRKTDGQNTINPQERGLRKQMAIYHKHRQYQLSAKQMKVILQDYYYYQAFLCLTLSGKKVSLAQFMAKNKGIARESLNTILQDLVNIDLISMMDGEVWANNQHIKFIPGHEKVIRQRHREMLGDNDSPFYNRTIFLKSNLDMMEKFKARLADLEDQFMTYEEINPDDNTLTFQLSIDLNQKENMSF